MSFLFFAETLYVLLEEFNNKKMDLNYPYILYHDHALNLFDNKKMDPHMDPPPPLHQSQLAIWASYGICCATLCGTRLVLCVCHQSGQGS